jgi:hypothetical protein
MDVMNEEKSLYVLVRIRKSGSQSLVEMIRGALPDRKIHSMPPDPPLADLGVGFFEDFRRVRRTKKRLWKLFKVTGYPEAWKHLNRNAVPGSVISGHFKYGSPVLPDWDLKYITIMRDPVGRLYSEYRYGRQSYFQRPVWRRFYLAERLKVAGKGTFRDYVAYLAKQGDRFSNPYVGYITGGRDCADPYEFLRGNYFHYGTLENIEHFADGIREKTGASFEPVWKNATRKSGDLGAEDYDEAEIKKLLGKDIDLYEKLRLECA